MIKSIFEALFVRASPQPLELPILPVDTILFPGGILSLRIFERSYQDMMHSCFENSAPVGLCLIALDKTAATNSSLEPVGTVARIVNAKTDLHSPLCLRVQGEECFRLQTTQIIDNGLLIGKALPIRADGPVSCPELLPCAEFLRKIIGRLGAPHIVNLAQFNDARWVSFRLTEILPLGNPVKQKMLELTDTKIRLEILYRFLCDQKLIGEV